MKTISSALILGLVALSAASAGTVYNTSVSYACQASGTCSVTGTITTDGALGTLGASDITAINLTISTPAGQDVATKLSDLPFPALLLMKTSGNNLILDPTTSTVFEVDSDNFSSGVSGSAASFYIVRPANPIEQIEFYKYPGGLQLDGLTFGSNITAVVLGTVSSAPEPTSFALLSFAGLGILGALKLRPARQI